MASRGGRRRARSPARQQEAASSRKQPPSTESSPASASDRALPLVPTTVARAEPILFEDPAVIGVKHWHRTQNGALYADFRLIACAHRARPAPPGPSTA